MDPMHSRTLIAAATTATALRSSSPQLPLLPAATSEFSTCRYVP
jgi:hypothetical protein